MSKSRPSKVRQPIDSSDFWKVLDSIAPFDLAAAWDNVGLIAGGDGWPVRRVLLAIDLTDAVAREALRKRVDAVVAYHPPIFKGIQKISFVSEAPTTMLAELLAARISIFAVHTAWDAAVGGTNDALLDLFEMQNRGPVQPIITKDRRYKLVVFVPSEHLDRLRRALAKSGAGSIGAYDECSFAGPGRGTFRGDETTHPAVGERGRLESVEEQRLEMILPASSVRLVIQALFANHPYEEPAYDLIPLHEVAQRGAGGMGRVGGLKKPATGLELVKRLRGHVDLSVATVAGDLRQEFWGVLAAAGSFEADLLQWPKVLVLTGEMRHHDQLKQVRTGTAGTGIICLGHDRSERPGLRRLRERLARALPGVRFELAQADVSPTGPLPGRRGN